MELEGTSGNQSSCPACSCENSCQFTLLQKWMAGSVHCCSMPWMQQVSAAALWAGTGLACGIATHLSTRTQPAPKLFWLRQKLEQLQCWAGCCGCVYTQQHLSARLRGGFLSFPPSLFLLHAAVLRCCQPLPALPHKCASAVLPSPPLTSPRREVGDTEG